MSNHKYLKTANNSTDILQNKITVFVGIIRSKGFNIGVSELLDAHLIVLSTGLQELKTFRLGLRSLFCQNENNWYLFDNLFNDYWLKQKPSTTKSITSSMSTPRSLISDKGLLGNKAGTNQEQDNDVDLCLDSKSQVNVDNQKGTKKGASNYINDSYCDFRFITQDFQLKAMDKLVLRLAKSMRRRSIRRQKINNKKSNIDIRVSLRKSLSTGSVPIKLIYKKNKKIKPRLIILIDVSRSMSLYSYMFLRFSYALIKAFRYVDVFAFHTHLVRIDQALCEDSLIKIRDKLSLLSAGWAGGTKIGQSMKSFIDNYKEHISSQSVVIIISDGLDTGNSGLLTQQLKLIKRRCRKLVWLNPLLGYNDYEVKTTGMLATLPYIDLFAPVHNLDSLYKLEKELIKI